MDVPAGCPLGIRVTMRDEEPTGQEVMQVKAADAGFIAAWNGRSAVTFSKDMVRVGDVIIAANEARNPEDIK